MTLFHIHIEITRSLSRCQQCEQLVEFKFSSYKLHNSNVYVEYYSA